MQKSRKKNNTRGFTLVELIFVIFAIVFITLLFLPNLLPLRRGGHRIICTWNLKSIWKGISAWKFDQPEEMRHIFPEASMAKILAEEGGYDPQLLICPDAAKTCNTKPHVNIKYADKFDENCGEHNSNYQYFQGRTEIDSTKILICDKNGTASPNAGTTNWGGNHSGKGGNVITVSGRVLWIPADPATGSAIQPEDEPLDLESMFSGTAKGY